MAASIPSAPTESGAAAPAPKAVARETIEVRAQAANVRKDAGANAPVLRTARKGERFAVFSQKDDWLEVGDKQPAGWIHRSLVEQATER
ncbi:SH3 domain-containing protein [Azospirillum brasilense]|uniref:SH3 domain-containing protein n=1 Tax=Azospirillum argentinense TaxID=2970906 RepID=UPI00190D79D3|nr:SH3 domain-containing protein [Azospirillum argentinense]